MHASDWLSFAFSFGVVLALLGALLYALKRMQSGNLLGITAQEINTLASFYLSAEELAADAAAQTNSTENTVPLAQRFAELIKSAQNKDKA